MSRPETCSQALEIGEDAVKALGGGPVGAPEFDRWIKHGHEGTKDEEADISVRGIEDTEQQCNGGGWCEGGTESLMNQLLSTSPSVIGSHAVDTPYNGTINGHASVAHSQSPSIPALMGRPMIDI